MKRLLQLTLVGALCLAGMGMPCEARSLTDGKGIPVVSNPKDLSLVDLKPLALYMEADLKNKGDFGPVRHFAMDYKAKRLGLPDPKTQVFRGGAVITRGSSGKSSAVIVVYGDINGQKLMSEFGKDFLEYGKTRGNQAKTGQREIGGITFNTFDFSERPYVVCLGNLPKEKCFVMASIPRDDAGVVEETLKVLKGEEKLNEELPAEVDADTTVEFTPREIEQLVKFNRPSGGLRAKVATGMKTLAGKLGIPHSDDETVPLEERIRGQIAQCESITTKYHWDRAPRHASAYGVTYQIRTKTPEAAQQMRELISEQVVRMSERSTREDEKEALGKITVQASDNVVTFVFLLDSPEAQYQHVSLLLSQMMRYKNLTSFLDRYGSGG